MVAGAGFAYSRRSLYRKDVSIMPRGRDNSTNPMLD
jgi:hypothetical protein